MVNIDTAQKHSSVKGKQITIIAFPASLRTEGFILMSKCIDLVVFLIVLFPDPDIAAELL